MHDTKVLHITVRKVCHAVCPEAILDLNGNYGNGKRDALKRIAAVEELSDSDGEAAETDHLQKKNWREGGRVSKKEQRRKTNPITV